MGYLLDGHWHEDAPSTDKSGRFVRQASRFRNWVTPDGSPGPAGEGGFPAEAGRYHLYVSLACPWAHRTLIFRKLKKLEDVIGVSIVDPISLNEGWVFSDAAGAIPDTIEGKQRLSEIYVLANGTYTGRVTVPVLWDKKKKTIVNNESSEIIRMFNSAFDAFTSVRADYYPKALRAEIDAINQPIYETVNNGVYRAGFATKQEAYEEACRKLFATLDMLESVSQRSAISSARH
jgi:glutathionyl-hydroquinone reductase